MVTIMDANRNALWHEPERVPPRQAERLTAYWGDESWREAAYRPKEQRSLFGDELDKVENQMVAEAFQKRLRDAAGFPNVPAPMPMRSNRGAVVYSVQEAVTISGPLAPVVRFPTGSPQTPHWYSWISPSGRTRSSRSRTGWAARQRGQNRAVAWNSSKAARAAGGGVRRPIMLRS
jgi:hypothetical protein